MHLVEDAMESPLATPTSTRQRSEAGGGGEEPSAVDAANLDKAAQRGGRAGGGEEPSAVDALLQQLMAQIEVERQGKSEQAYAGELER